MKIENTINEDLTINKRRVALFDLDRTLIPLDSDQQWGVFTCSIGWNDTSNFLAQNERFHQNYCEGTLNLAEYIRFNTQAIRDRGKKESMKAREQFISEVIRKAIRPEALDLVRKHRESGDLIAIVTATNRFVVEPICALFGVDEIIAVELIVDENSGWYNGEIDGIPSLKEGKVTRTAEWLATKGLSWDLIESTFYSDSHNDISLLDRVNRPIATNPDPTLRAVAQQRHWEILDLFIHQ
jgi:HAD superfamily hydrolase (TIGR01490 family)